MTSSRFEVVVTGDPKPFVTWYRDECKLASNEKYEISTFDDTHNLKILLTDLSDVGTYKVEAENSGGISTSTASLQVTLAPTFSMELPKHVTAIENKPYSFEVQAQGIPPPSISFYKNDAEIMESESIAIQENDKIHTLCLKNVTETDKGNYKVVALNSVGQVASNCVLDVLNSPNVVQGLSDLRVRNYQDVTLTIQIQGDSLANVTWKCNGKNVEEHVNMTATSNGLIHTLSINKIEISQGGNYEVTISNDAGSYSSTANIMVEGKSLQLFS